MALSNYIFQLDRFPLNVLHLEQDAIGIHHHAFHELVLVVSGEGRHVTASEEYTISGGDLFLIKPGNPHGYKVEKNISLYNILYYPERLNLPLFDLADEPGYRAFFELEPELRRRFGFRKHFRLGKSQLDEIELLVQRIAREIGSEEPGHNYRAATLFMRLTERIAATFSNSTLYRENDELFRLSELVGYLERHRAEPLAVAALAERAAMSPATLNRAFRRAVGKSPLHYLNDLRISGAEQLLLDKPELPVAAVAAECGFADSNYFSRLFKKRTGHTPRAFRQRDGGRI